MTTPASNPGRMQWLGDEVPVTPCDIASASTGEEGIALAFGQREAADVPGALRGRLHHRIELQPDAAAGLRQMLARLLEASSNPNFNPLDNPLGNPPTTQR